MHCLCCAPVVCAKGWRVCGQGGAHKPGVGGAQLGWRGLSTNGKEGVGALSMLCPCHPHKGVEGMWAGWGT